LPLSERARIEVFLPDLPRAAYQRLLAALEQEFTYTFGGCTVARGHEGLYLSADGAVVRDDVIILFSDTPFALESSFERISAYVDALRTAAHEALDEEAILIAVSRVHHSQ